MRVSYSVVGQVREGQIEASTALAAEAAELVGSYGADSRFFITTAAGESVNVTAFTMEFESPEALGDCFDKMSGDLEVQGFVSRLHGPSSPTQILANTMALELPIRTPKSGRGAIVEAHTSKVHPGRMGDFLAQSTEVCDFVEANGAMNARALQLTYAGMASGTTVVTWELENMRAQAELAGAWFSGDGQAIQTRARGADGPTTPLTSALYTAIPI